MADPSLNDPVTITPTRIDATILPSVFSIPYQLYVIQNGMDFGNVADKANHAGSGAYDAQVKNEEQDVELANHEERIAVNELAVSQLTIRVIDAEAAIVSIESDVATLTTRVTTVEGTVTTIQGDYLSKSATTNQVIQSSGGALIVGPVPIPTTDKIQSSDSVNVLISYKVAGTKVIGARQTGWTAATGGSYLGVFDANATFFVGATYNQSEQQAVSNNLTITRLRLKAIEDALRAHGLIN